METKICTSMYWKKQIRFLFGICILSALAVIVFSGSYKDLEMFVISGSCALLYILIVFVLMFFFRRLLTDVIINESGFKSVFLNKKMAVVNSNQTIYYAIFEESEGVYSRAKFILVSNSAFKYIPRKNIFSKSMIGRYDIHAQILIPYNSETIKFFDLEKWICVS